MSDDKYSVEAVVAAAWSSKANQIPGVGGIVDGGIVEGICKVGIKAVLEELRGRVSHYMQWDCDTEAIDSGVLDEIAERWGIEPALERPEPDPPEVIQALADAKELLRKRK